MKKYIKLLSLSIKVEFSYRKNFFIRIFLKLIVIILSIFVWRAVFQTNGFVYGYNFNTMIIYIFMANLTFELTDFSNVSYNIANEVLEGKLSSHLIKPYSYQTAKFFETLGSKITVFPFYMLLYITCILGILVLLNDKQINLSVIMIVYVFVFSAGAVLLNFLIDFILGILSFNIENPTVVFFIKAEIVSLLSGTIIPLDAMPDSLVQVFHWLPFKFSGYVQGKLLLNSPTNDQIIADLFLLFVWTLIMFLLAKSIWKSAIRKYKSVGG